MAAGHRSAGRCVQLGHRLVEVDADPAHQPGGANELTQRPPLRAVIREASATGNRERRPRRERAPGQPGLVGSGPDLTELRLGQIEPDGAGPLYRLAGPAPGRR
jgi:hypothetical protein